MQNQGLLQIPMIIAASPELKQGRGRTLFSGDFFEDDGENVGIGIPAEIDHLKIREQRHGSMKAIVEFAENLCQELLITLTTRLRCTLRELEIVFGIRMTECDC